MQHDRPTDRHERSLSHSLTHSHSSPSLGVTFTWRGADWRSWLRGKIDHLSIGTQSRFKHMARYVVNVDRRGASTRTPIASGPRLLDCDRRCYARCVAERHKLGLLGKNARESKGRQTYEDRRSCCTFRGRQKSSRADFYSPPCVRSRSRRAMPMARSR